MADFDPIEFRLNTSADLKALEQAKAQYLDLQRTVKQGTPEFTALAGKISSIDAVMQGNTATLIRQKEALENLIQTTRKMGGDTFDLEAQLGNVNNALGVQGKVVPKLDDDVKHLHLSHRALYMATSELSRQIPGLGNAMHLLHYGFKSQIAVIMAGATALAKYIEHQKEFQAFLEQAPQWNDGLTESIKKTNEAMKQASIDAVLYDEALIRVAHQAETAAENVSKLAAIRGNQRSAEEQLEDRRKALDIAKVETYETDPIKKAEKLLAIEEKAAEAKRRRQDQDAKTKMVEMQRQMGSEEGEAQSLFGARPRMVDTAGKAQTRYERAKASVDKMEEDKKKAEKRLEEIESEKTKLTGPLGLLYSVSSYQQYGMLNKEQEGLERLLHNIAVNKPKQEEHLTPFALEAKTAKKALDDADARLSELNKHIKEMGKEFEAASSKFTIEANSRLADQRMDQITKRYEMVRKIAEQIDQGVDVDANKKKMAGLMTTIGVLEASPVPTEKLFPGGVHGHAPNSIPVSQFGGETMFPGLPPQADLRGIASGLAKRVASAESDGTAILGLLDRVMTISEKLQNRVIGLETKFGSQIKDLHNP